VTVNWCEHPLQRKTLRGLVGVAVETTAAGTNRLACVSDHRMARTRRAGRPLEAMLRGDLGGRGGARTLGPLVGEAEQPALCRAH